MLSDSFVVALPVSGTDRTATPLQNQVAELFEHHRDNVYRYLLTLGLHPPQAQEATEGTPPVRWGGP